MNLSSISHPVNFRLHQEPEIDAILVNRAGKSKMSTTQIAERGAQKEGGPPVLTLFARRLRDAYIKQGLIVGW